MKLNSHDWSLSLDLNGGRIQELSHKGVKVFGTYTRIDGKVGNAHLCIPSFDKEGQEKYGLPFHGLVRNISWIVKSQSVSSITLSCNTPPSETFPAELSIEQEFDLQEDFIHTVRVFNTKGREVPVNIGIHYYWDTPKGWNNTLINGSAIRRNIETNGYIDLKETNTIRFPHANYTLTSQRLHSAVLWTSFKLNTDGNKQFSEDFCCVEPVIGWPGYFGTKESMVKPGEQKSVSVTLCAGERT